MPKPIRGNVEIRCGGCKRLLDLSIEANKAERMGVRGINCPYCNHSIGKLN